MAMRSRAHHKRRTTLLQIQLQRTTRMPRGNPPVAASTDPAAHALADEAGNAEQSAGVSADPTLAAAGNVPDGPPMVRPIQAPAVAPATIPPQAEAQSAQEEV